MLWKNYFCLTEVNRYTVGFKFHAMCLTYIELLTCKLTGYTVNSACVFIGFDNL